MINKGVCANGPWQGRVIESRYRDHNISYDPNPRSVFDFDPNEAVLETVTIKQGTYHFDGREWWFDDA